MSTRVHFIQNCIAAAAALLMMLSLTPQTSAAEEPLVLGIFPRFAATVVHDSFAPLAKYLSDELGREVKIETTKDQALFWDALTSKRYDIVHFNQMHYVESHLKIGYDVVAMNEEFGKATIAGALMVRKDSGIEKIGDLKGKTIVFGGGPKAMGAYIAPTTILRRAGLNKGDYREEFAKSPVNAIMAVFYKQAAAGGTGDVVVKFQSVDANINVDELRTLATSEPMPHLAWAVKSSLGSQFFKQVQDALLKVKASKNGAKILETAQLTNLVMAKDSDYELVRKMIKEVASDTEPKLRSDDRP